MSGAASSLTVRVPLAIRRRPGRKTVVRPGAAAANTTTVTRADPTLLKALARAHRYQRLLDDGCYTSISELADAEKLDRGYVGQLLRLTLLAPDLVEAVLDGRSSTQLLLPALMRGVSASWLDQRAAWHLPQASTHLRIC